MCIVGLSFKFYFNLKVLSKHSKKLAEAYGFYQCTTTSTGAGFCITHTDNQLLGNLDKLKANSSKDFYLLQLLLFGTMRLRTK